MEYAFKFADLHCHPTLKTYGHSYSNTNYGRRRRSIWFQTPPTRLRKMLLRKTGLTKFSQADFSSLKSGNVKIVTASLYPFEKGFFINLCGGNWVSAWLANVVTGISSYRIRNIQTHQDYFADLEKEYRFLVDSVKADHRDSLFFAQTKSDFLRGDKTAIVLAIEGAHVFNSGLSKYGRKSVEAEILNNIDKVKRWDYPPLTITFAHNFSNELCGHAKSLDPLGRLVDQNDMLDEGFNALGIKVLDALLDKKNGRPIFPDLKHMSLKSRRDYYHYLVQNNIDQDVPLVVSHGAVTGVSWDDADSDHKTFANCDINFFDQEIVLIAKSRGVFALQLDGRRLAHKTALNQLNRSRNPLIESAELVWNHLRHIAIVLDSNGLPAWDISCIGSDFDGTISPLPGIYTASDLPDLAGALLPMAAYFIETHPFRNPANKHVTAEHIVGRFCYGNLCDFYMRHYPD